MDIQEFRQQHPEYNDMPDLELAGSLHRKFYSDMPASEFVSKFVGKPQEPSFMEKYFPSVKRAGDIFTQEISEGTKALQDAYEEPTAKSVGKGILGAAKLAFSPFTAAAKGYVGEPVQQLAKTVGLGNVTIGSDNPIIGKITADKLIGDTAENLAQVFPYGAKVKQAIMDTQAPALGLLEKITKSGGYAPPLSTKNPLKYVTEPSPTTAQKFAATGQLNKPVVEEGIQEITSKDAVGAFQKLIEQKQAMSDLTKIAAERGIPETKLPELMSQHGINPEAIRTIEDKSKRVGQKIIDLVHKGDFEFAAIPGVLEKYKITPEEFAQELKNTYSTAGRSLARLSWASKQLNKMYSEAPDAAKYFDEISKTIEPELGFFDKTYKAIYGLEQHRRALLVGQLATGIRNIESQGIRMGISAVEDSVDGMLQASIGGKGNYAENVGKGLDVVQAFFNKLRPEKRQRIQNIITERYDDLVKLKYHSPATAETVTGKITGNVFNALNNWQEFFFRRAALDAKLTQLFKKNGIPENIAPKDIPEGILKEAVDYSLEMTFAAMPKSQAGKQMMQVLSNPLFTMLSNPFPRFAYANAIPFMVNYSPLGFLKAFKPGVMADLASGKPEQFARAASKAMIGSTMLGGAMSIRANADPASKWYEIPVGDNRYVDTRAFAPFSSYLLLAEMYLHPERLDVGDIGGAIIGLNRIAGTGLVLTDVMRSQSMEQAVDALKRLPESYMGGFTVPARTSRDFLASVNQEEAKIRDTKGEGIFASAKANIPFFSQDLPAAVSPLKTEPMKTESPLLRQFSGLSVRTKTPLEQEIDKLNMNKSSLFPRTRLPAADRMLVKKMAPVIEKYGTALIQTPGYQALTDTQKQKLLLDILVNPAKEAAKKQLMAENPTIGLILEYEKQPSSIKSIIKENPNLVETLNKYGISTKKYLNEQKVREVEKSQYVLGGNK